MKFYEVLEQVLVLLQRHGRVSYRALKRQFDLDDEALDDLKEELLYAHPVVDDEGKGLIWTGESETKPEPISTPPAQQEITQQAQPAQAEPRHPEPPTPDAERRQLTVMFCDLADSTKLSGQLDPEDLRDVIRAYQSTSAEVIERYDGYIAQHLGDGLMVYFGWPQAHEDDAQRAVHTGLGIIEAMGQLNARLAQDKGICLAVRIGIHTGLVVVGEIGQGASQEHLALGETPNVASRIEGMAERDTMVISAATYQLVQGYFLGEDLGHHTLKGVSEPQQVYRILRENDTQSRLDVAATHGLTPLVGRESEVTLLLERWQQVNEGQGQVVLLSGEAGIGKSRLLQVLRDHVSNESHIRLECRSSPYYQNTALYPITNMFQRVLNWHQDDTPEAKLDKLEQTLCHYRLELDETIPLFANLLSLTIPADRYAPLSLSPQLQRQKTLAMIVAMLLQQAEEQPVLFILEDLHWTDPSTLELSSLLIDQAPTAAICVLLTCRPSFQPTWSSRSYLTPIALTRLSRSQIESMAERVAGGKRLPREVLQQIVEKTDGVPLFVEEMTKAVLESEVLKEVNGHYELVGMLSSLTIPSTLQDSLLARLDRMVTAKAVAQYAAVLGRQFSYRLLQAVSQLDEAMLQHELGRLVEAELVYQRGAVPQATYTFKHALVQDAAYQSLLKSTRQQYHQRIAQVLVAQFPEVVENQPELLAHHYTEAGLIEQAIGYWHKAGQNAVERSANIEAINHLQHGLDMLSALPGTAARTQQELVLLTDIGPALIATHGPGALEVEPVYARAHILCRQVDDHAHLFPVLRGLMNFYLVRGKLQVAHDLAEQSLTLAKRVQDAALLLEAHWMVGVSYVFGGAFLDARMHLEQGLTHNEPTSTSPFHALQHPAVGCLVYGALALWFLGYPDQSRARIDAALALAQEISHPYSLMWAKHFQALLAFFRREAPMVQEEVEASITEAIEQSAVFWQNSGKVMRGWALAVQGQGKDAIMQMHQGIQAHRASGAELVMPRWLAALGEAYGTLGQPKEGLRFVDEALAIMDETGERRDESELYRLQGELLLQQSPDNQTEAETCFYQALDIARRQQAKSLELRAATSLARLWQSQGKRQDAYDLLQPVYGWFTEGFDTADLRDAKALLAELSDGPS